jgi:uncharacterized membrane protein YadS
LLDSTELDGHAREFEYALYGAFEDGARARTTPAAAVRARLIDLDTILLSSAMFALGVGTRWDQLRQAGTRPLLLAATIFGDLVGGGFLLTSVPVR